MALRNIIALLGRRDEPTDGVRDYCKRLGEALSRRGILLEQWELAWERPGWTRAFTNLAEESANWSGKWVLLQYTALGWSRRGFPTKVPRILRKLRDRRVRCAVVFHDANPWVGRRIRDQIRTRVQISCMRHAYHLAELGIFPISLDRVSWLPPNTTSRAAFIPIGPNLPECSLISWPENPSIIETKRIAIFGVTEHDIDHEVSQIQSVINRVKVGVPRLELTVLGRGSASARTALEKAFAGHDVKVSILGILPEEEIAGHLAKADALLFVRGSLSLRRGTLLAAMFCGVPIVGYEGPETEALFKEAGVKTARSGDIQDLASALTRVLSDDKFRQELRHRSKSTFTQHFSWDKIAEQFVGVLSNA